MTLIILGYPNFDKSFANKKQIEQLQNCDLDIEVEDIQNLYPNYNIEAKAEQAALLRHQTIVLQYPIY